MELSESLSGIPFDDSLSLMVSSLDIPVDGECVLNLLTISFHFSAPISAS